MMIPRSLSAGTAAPPEAALTQQADAIVLPEAERVLRRAIYTAPIVNVTLPGHSKGVKFAAWSPDGKQVVTAGLDNTARIWDASSGVELQRLEGHTSEVRSASWSPDGQRSHRQPDKTIRSGMHSPRTIEAISN
jgi:dipeptidyl aminopeptidase/acylaminoacyl peptidase